MHSPAAGSRAVRRCVAVRSAEQALPESALRDGRWRTGAALGRGHTGEDLVDVPAAAGVGGLAALAADGSLAHEADSPFRLRGSEGGQVLGADEQADREEEHGERG